MQFKLILLVSAVLMSAALADVFDLKQGVIVQLFEWKWTDIAKECKDFLAPRGFAGVQISPPNENLVIRETLKKTTVGPLSKPQLFRPWWERYQPVSYQKLKTRSGTKQELEDMIKECNKHKIRVFVDAVLNNMSAKTSQTSVGTDDSEANYDNYKYDEINGREYFHFYCIMSDNDSARNVRNCELEGKRDLDQSKDFVRMKQVNYLNKLIDMGVAGFRIHAARNMWPNDLKNIFLNLKDLNEHHGFDPGTRPFIYQEVVEYEPKDTWREMDRKGITWSEYSHLGMVTDYQYAEAMSQTFQGLENFNWFKYFALSKKLIPSETSIVFIDNYDTQRKPINEKYLSYEKFRPYKMAVAFMLAYPWGTPKIFSGYDMIRKDIDIENRDNIGPPDENEKIKSPEFDENNACIKDWICEHRWRQIYNMVKFHNVVAGTGVKFTLQEEKKVAFCRGNKGFIAFNTDVNTKLNAKLQTCLPPGLYCDVISGELVGNKCEGKNPITVKVDEKGNADIDIKEFIIYDRDVERDNVLAIHIESKISDTKIEEWCKNKKEDKDIIYCDPKKGYIALSKQNFIPGRELEKVCLPEGIYCDVVSGGMVNNVCTGKVVVVEKGIGKIMKNPTNKCENEEDKDYLMVGIHLEAKASGATPAGATGTPDAKTSPPSEVNFYIPKGDLLPTGQGENICAATIKKAASWLPNPFLKNNSAKKIDSNLFCGEIKDLLIKKDISSLITYFPEDNTKIKSFADKTKEFLLRELVSLVK